MRRGLFHNTRVSCSSLSFCFLSCTGSSESSQQVLQARTQINKLGTDIFNKSESLQLNFSSTVAIIIEYSNSIFKHGADLLLSCIFNVGFYLSALHCGLS